MSEHKNLYIKDNMSNTVIAKDNTDNAVDSFSNVNVIKSLDITLSTHTHKKYLKKITDLVNKEVFVRDGNDLCRLCDLPHENKGGDFQSVDLYGDLKFLTMGASVCMGGGVNMQTIHDQGKMLVIVYHPKDDKNTPVYAGFVDVWSVKGTQDEAIDLVTEYEKWNINGRKDVDNVEFNTNNFFIKVHEKEDDRFYVKASFIKEHIQYFCKNEKYLKKTGIESKISRFKMNASNKIESNLKKKVEYKSMTLKEFIKNIENNVFYVPKYQRDLLPNKEFLKKYVVETIMSGQSENRGVFMLHDTADGKIAVVDGQQRLYNAIKGFFIGNHRLPASDVNTVVDGKVYDLSNLTWSDILDMAKEDKDIQPFVEFVLNSKFVCKVYHGYTINEMASEYRIANSGAQMKDQELRASFDSRLGDIVRYITTPSLRDDEAEIRKVGIKTFDSFIFSTIPSKETLKYINISTFRMNVDEVLSFMFHSCMNWKEGYTESQRKIDELYQKYTDLSSTVKAWKKTEEFLEILSSIVEKYNEAKDSEKYSKSGDRGSRTHRSKGYVIAKQEELDLVLFLVLELMRRNNGKKLTVEKNVLTDILENHYKYVQSGNKVDYESSYGMSVRKGQRTWEEINKIWFPKWEWLLNSNEKDLRKMGFDFS